MTLRNNEELNSYEAASVPATSTDEDVHSIYPPIPALHPWRFPLAHKPTGPRILQERAEYFRVENRLLFHGYQERVYDNLSLNRLLCTSTLLSLHYFGFSR